MFGFLLFIAAIFVGYAVVTQWKNTDSGQSVPKRVYAALVLAVSVIIAAFQTGGQ